MEQQKIPTAEEVAIKKQKATEERLDKIKLKLQTKPNNTGEIV